MEGLIPIIFRTIKRTKTRRSYECLSSGTAQSYNIADFYDTGTHGHMYVAPPPEKMASFHAEGNGGTHRRHKSLGDGLSPEHMVKSKQMVRFRSHRMFSCVTGA
ncbi:uncharacterized protein LOC132275985 [Cornus florida]|uniref:uncharacterized protein LOC132275985 n=1 Tax=Cornus florida TaxID=4283 RepID=UPI00289BFE7E|nr:uncharacterized protein LOC132275985 [Cornus florida]